MEIYRARAADKKRQPNPQIVEEITLHVEIAADAPEGGRELRLITPSGMSNPLWFYVARWPEYKETEPNNDTPDAAVQGLLPAVINGQVMPGDVDRFSFRARQGARLVMVVSARELVPYLADAVPGWFQAVLVLRDAQGKELAYAGAYYYRQDPVICYEIPEDGEYIVEIRDSIYRGREDFVYRITIGELPLVTGMFPLGARTGTQVDLELLGWNLTKDKASVKAIYERGRPIRWYEIPQTESQSVHVPLAIDRLSDCVEQEPNDARAQAQTVEFPIIVNGRIDQPGDCDVFKFEAHGSLVAEVYARRFRTPVDSVLQLTDADGKELASNDDYEDRAVSLLTHHADSRILVTLPGTGTYYLRVADAQDNGGPNFIYRLHIRRPRPDFELRVVPSSLAVRPGATVPIAVHALRREGFDHDIQLGLDRPPKGFTLSGAWVPAGQNKVRLTLTVPKKPTDGPIRLQMFGGSHTRGRKIFRLAVPSEEMMQAFLWQHLVPAKDWTVLVSSKARTGSSARLAFDEDRTARLIAGRETRLLAFTTSKQNLEQIRLELSEPPDGITLETSQPHGASIAATINTDAEKAKPGTKGNLIFTAFREWTPTDAEGKPLKPRRSPIGALPAVPFEVVAPGKSVRRPRD
jgi:hypothetical protein